MAPLVRTGRGEARERVGMPDCVMDAVRSMDGVKDAFVGRPVSTPGESGIGLCGYRRNSPYLRGARLARGSYSIVRFSQSILVSLAHPGHAGLGVLFTKVSFVPVLHRGHGMIGGSQRLFRADRFHPGVHRLFVSQAELI